MSKNIVMLTMGLNIGGAETHIVELAKALKDKGHNVTVFSSGGVYAEHLENHGITHIVAPMNTKKLDKLSYCIKLLENYCKTHPVSVIHSHTRITNFIADRVCKKLRLPLVTTVHFNFRLNFFTKLFSRWGDRQLSVSEDLKDYVCDGYGIERNKVRITVNGINLDTFSEGTNPELRATYNLNEEHKVILCVSRIDAGACENVFRFLQSAKEIYDRVPMARVVVVGAGNRFDELKQIAADINAKTCENYIQLAGAQTSIADYCRMADAFAGVSRSALEAMACKKPTLLIGNAGYLGVYSKDTHQACIDTNFTYRGYDYVSAHEVADIMVGMLTSPEKYKENIESAYELVRTRYSVVAMAEDALASYSEAANDLRENDIMISGYYGTGNFGDDITLDAIIRNISQQYPLKSITVLGHTNQSIYDDSRIHTLHRFDLWHILPLMKRTKLFLLGGGSLLQDKTSNRSIFYYLFMLHHAHKFGCKTMVYSNGIGPIYKKAHKRQLAKLLPKVDRITIRDKASYEYLQSIGVTNAILTADEAYNYPPNAKDLSLSTDLPEGKKVLLVNLRTTAAHTNETYKCIASAINTVAKKYELYPMLLPAQYEQDKAPLKTVSAQLKCPHHLFDKPLNNAQIITLIQNCDYMLAERLHPIIFAAIMKKPFTCIVYDPKIQAVAEQFGMLNFSVRAEDIQTKELADKLGKMIENADNIHALLSPVIAKLTDAARRNSEIAGELLDS